MQLIILLWLSLTAIGRDSRKVEVIRLSPRIIFSRRREARLRDLGVAQFKPYLPTMALPASLRQLA